MGLDAYKILGVKITAAKKNIVLEEVRKYLKLGVRGQGSGVRNSVNPLIIFTPNPEIIEFAQKDISFKKIVNTAQINIADGRGIVWAVKKIHHKEIVRTPGTDFMLDLCRLSCKKGAVVGLIGAKAGVAVEALECLQKKYPGLSGEVFEVGEVPISSNLSSLGYLGDLSSSVVSWILQKNINILFVALGFPKQEYFIDRIKNQVLRIKYDKSLVFMSVGGALDYISGRVPRAPFWMRKRGLEWLYRLMKEPTRWKRQLSGLRFFSRILFKSLK